MTNQKRAAKGGEIAPNGEFYKGGAFIATTDKAKGKPQNRGSGRVEIAPYTWDQCPEGSFSIYRAIAGIHGIFSYDYNQEKRAAENCFVELRPNMRYLESMGLSGDEVRNELKRLADMATAFNCGKRFWKIKGEK